MDTDGEMLVVLEWFCHLCDKAHHRDRLQTGTFIPVRKSSPPGRSRSSQTLSRLCWRRRQTPLTIPKCAWSGCLHDPHSLWCIEDCISCSGWLDADHCTSLQMTVIEYQVIGRHLPTEHNPTPKLYRMRLFAPNEVVAKSRFWYFLRCVSILPLRSLARAQTAQETPQGQESFGRDRERE